MQHSIFHERIRDVDFRLASQPGVFAHRGLDAGTRLLIDNMRITPTTRVLDLGTGYGVIGLVAAKLAPRGSAALVDSDIRATRLAQRNIELNGVTNAEVILGDGVHDLPSKARFDVVVSNPPTHSGREVLDDFVAGAYHVLKPRGQLYLVVNRLLSLRREVDRVFGSSEVLARSKGFVVIRATKQARTRTDDFEE
jgi:16S rRNA (guanine1207-N2)-methyltransferase